MNTGMRGWTIPKIRAHQSLLRGDRGVEEQTRVLGNHWADVLAKEIATNQLNPQDVERVEAGYKLRLDAYQAFVLMLEP
eukprot:933595-Pyramimonas_sp.AAC.1